MNKNVLMICESMYHGNTKRLADGMAAELKCKVVNCEQAKQMDLTKYQVIGLGSGIYFTSHHPEIVAIAKTLSKDQQVFIFSTRGCPVVGKYHTTLKEALRGKNVKLLGEFSCKGYDCTGPYNLSHGGNVGRPNEKDVLRARKYIRKILPQYCSDLSTTKHVFVEQSGCIQCKNCVNVCPMHVFGFEDGKIQVKEPENCVHCNKCVDECMQGCIAIHHSKWELIRIAKKHAWRKSL